jgi:hypothetical protein
LVQKIKEDVKEKVTSLPGHSKPSRVLDIQIGYLPTSVKVYSAVIVIEYVEKIVRTYEFVVSIMVVMVVRSLARCCDLYYLLIIC